MKTPKLRIDMMEITEGYNRKFGTAFDCERDMLADARWRIGSFEKMEVALGISSAHLHKRCKALGLVSSQSQAERIEKYMRLHPDETAEQVSIALRVDRRRVYHTACIKKLEFRKKGQKGQKPGSKSTIKKTVLAYRLALSGKKFTVRDLADEVEISFAAAGAYIRIFQEIGGVSEDGKRESRAGGKRSETAYRYRGKL